MKKLILVIIWLQLSACSAILHKVAPEKSLTQQEFMTLNPQNIQVKVNLEQTASLEVGQSFLTLQATHQGRILEQAFKIELEKKVKLNSDSGWLSVMPATNDYYLVLTEQSVVQMKSFVNDYSKYSLADVHFNLEAKFSATGKKSQACYSSFIRLQRDDYFEPISQRLILEL